MPPWQRPRFGRSDDRNDREPSIQEWARLWHDRALSKSSSSTPDQEMSPTLLSPDQRQWRITRHIRPRLKVHRFRRSMLSKIRSASALVALSAIDG
jgi:hypothetical protein